MNQHSFHEQIMGSNPANQAPKKIDTDRPKRIATVVYLVA